ncbi:ABC transporter substrate-binding protein [Actinosynnema sp. NPDC047251]|uniref:ABC-type siderophore transporter,substrate-binding lipoprotein n=1 Tax=Saccharothrix espanaensis (strain ATCC 51144 / DSM 44229 / JCM 9112 / NBRC 15066 / NRRL 15764) TaxID=1179773 RepID=K0JQI9_SACES|nr:ABC transporter substrate-binding protein [Saccharothrix espanaensis]CCH29610.1 ABC-type siderophore transporter,substrate-binding lipoprotein [Saccharothrix espanaensis DSM 44229]
MTFRLAAAIAAAVLLTACGQVEETAGPAASGATVQTMFGPVTVPANPTKVVALGWSDAETALALGVRPIAAADWLAFGGEGVGPWAAGRYTTAPKILPTLEPDYAAIAQLQPDLILNTRSDNSEEKYRELSKIAPTVSGPAGVVSYGTTWRQQMELVSQSLGKPDEGRRLIGEVDAAFDRAKADNPVFAGKTAAIGAYYSEKYSAYVRGDSRVDFVEGLGLKNKPEVQALAGTSFAVDLSREQIELLSADLTVVFPIGGDAAPLRADQVLNQLPAARAGHLLIMDDKTLVNAFSSGSTLGTLYAIEKAVPLFASTLTK